MSDRKTQILNELHRIDGATPGQQTAIAKHRSMAENPFRFLRGAAQLFYADLANGVLELPGGLTEAVPLTTVMGDCHISNFGFMTEEGSHGDDVIFAPNDYDDACIGHAAWDLLRYCSSLFLASDFVAGVNQGRYPSPGDDWPKTDAASPDDARNAAGDFIRAYVKQLHRLQADPEQRQTALTTFKKGHVLAKPLAKARRRAAGGRDFNRKSALAKAVQWTEQGLRFADRPDRFERLDKKTADALVHDYRPYVDDHIIDLVERLGAGTGSLNMQRYYLLVGPANLVGEADLPLCHLVEVKQQRAAAPLHHFPGLSPINRLSPAHLTTVCQRRMQRRADLILDHAYRNDADWLLRSRHHARVGMDPEMIALGHKPGIRMRDYAKACGKALALAHARGDRRSTRFERAMSDALAREARTLISASEAYAERVDQDTRLLNEIMADRSNRSRGQSR